ncbi:hypothetical protein G4B88_004439 [Cannabis sativa]|uniref:Uncharacterized protein n=1 Tax=Cannabis sativa TaxID=3483 RepID=A0A7J6I0F2_CANSA|nr:hypothetical protein G4B88_004439 [Cannabis sativa]
MRLLTHNMLSSNIIGVTNGFPLRIEVVKVVEKEVELNPDFLKSMFSKIDWNALVKAARSIDYTELPNEMSLTFRSSIPVGSTNAQSTFLIFGELFMFVLRTTELLLLSSLLDDDPTTKFVSYFEGELRATRRLLPQPQEQSVEFASMFIPTF